MSSMDFELKLIRDIRRERALKAKRSKRALATHLRDQSRHSTTKELNRQKSRLFKFKQRQPLAANEPLFMEVGA